MKKKFLLMSIAISFICMSSPAQTIRDNIDKLAKDPKTMENAAKADVHIINKKIIHDSTQQAAQTGSSVKKKKQRKGKAS
ncbi:MAG: hypothetical protein ABR502_08300 [Chitinophagaceae bacterium]